MESNKKGSHKKRKYESLKTVSENALYKRYRINALRRDIVWRLESDLFKKLIYSNCFYCGEAPFCDYNVYISKTMGDLSVRTYEPERVNEYWIKYNGIDRIDSNLNYTPENCVTCCSHCNKAKAERSQIDFIEWVVKVYNYNKNNGQWANL